MTNHRQGQISKPRLTARGVLAFMLLLLLGLATAPVAQAQSAFTFNTLYDFQGSADGGNPLGGLIEDSAGNLYGTNTYSDQGKGVVFEISPSGKETTLYDFCNTGSNHCPDGSSPYSTLLMDSAGNLYGTTSFGGANNYGAVFELSPAPSGGVCSSGTNQGNGWCEIVLYSFTDGSDGANPTAALLQDSAGRLYSTASSGGTNNCGSVFELSPPTVSGGTWTETTMYDFTGIPSGQTSGDGCFPAAGVVLDNSGNLYGTTVGGGLQAGGAAGTVYELSPTSSGTWTETILYRFAGAPSDGAEPYSDLVFDGDNLYGTTEAGGPNGGLGAVFELLPSSGGSWTETILFNFTSATGCSPYGGVTFDPQGNMYGTTFSCAIEDNFGNFNGSVYELSPPTSGTTWAETTLYEFQGRNDGGNPYGVVLRDSSGNLYGATSNCDNCTYGAGSVWSLTLPTTTTTAVTSSLNPSTYGQSVAFTATIGSSSGQFKKQNGNSRTSSIHAKPAVVSGTVTWSANTGCGTTAVTSGYPGTATCATLSLPVGTNTITATYSGDASHATSTGSLSGGQVVDAPDVTTIAWSTPAPITYGTAMSSRQLDAKAEYNGKKVAGTFAYTPAAGTILTPGGQTLSVTFTPTETNTYTTATSSVTLVVNPIKPLMKIADTKDGLILALNFSVAAKYGQPTGSVTAASNNGGPSCTATLDGSGDGSCTLTFSNAGTYTLTETYSGDSNDESITATRAVDMTPLHTTTKITSVTPSPVTTNQPITVNFSVTASQGQPTGSVTVTSGYDGPSCTGTLTNEIGSCTLTFTGTGPYTLTAAYSGDSNDAASSANHNVKVVAGAPQP